MEISVIMSTYNESRTELYEAIESIVAQKFSNYEFIIVNDNPKNSELRKNIAEIEQKYSQIKVLWNDNNMGLAKSLNKAILQAKGKYIMRMDADDISEKTRMKIEYDYLESNTDCAMVSGNIIEINEKNEFISEPSKYSFRDDDLGRILKYGDVIVHPSVLIRKNVLDELGGYRNIIGAEDYDLWLRMISNGYKIHIISKPIMLYYRIRTSSITRTNYANSYFKSKYVVDLYRERGKLNTSDSFSEEHMTRYLEEKCKIKERESVINEFFSKLRGETRKSMIVWIMKNIIFYPYIMSIVWRLLRFKIMVNIWGNRGDFE